MRYTEAYAYYLEALRRDPSLPEPPLRLDTVEAFHEWKAELRARDAARIALGLATAAEIQQQNAAIPKQATPPRILKHALHGRTAAAHSV
jgi:hypothetical protein